MQVFYPGHSLLWISILLGRHVLCGHCGNCVGVRAISSGLLAHHGAQHVHLRSGSRHLGKGGTVDNGGGSRVGLVDSSIRHSAQFEPQCFTSWSHRHRVLPCEERIRVCHCAAQYKLLCNRLSLTRWIYHGTEKFLLRRVNRWLAILDACTWLQHCGIGGLRFGYQKYQSCIVGYFSMGILFCWRLGEIWVVCL